MTTPNDTLTNLFSPELMANIQTDVATKMREDYMRMNCIPTPEQTTPDLFKNVMTALVRGITAAPHTAMFLDPQIIYTIVQIVAPTLFIMPKLASQIDESVFGMVRECEEMHVAMMEYVSMKYIMTASGATEEKPDDAVTVAQYCKLEECFQNYASHVAEVLNILATAKFPMLGSFPSNGMCYNSASLMQKLLSESEVAIDRSLYVKATEFTGALKSVDNESIYERRHQTVAPAILGLDVLQLLACYTGERINYMTDVVMAAMLIRFGPKVVMLKGEEVIVADGYLKDVHEALAPHRDWLTRYLTDIAKPKAVETTDAWYSGDAVSGAWTKTNVPEQEVAKTAPLAVTFYPAVICRPTDDSLSISFRDLPLNEITPLTGDTLTERTNALIEVLTFFADDGTVIPKPSAPVEGEIMVMVTNDVLVATRTRSEQIRSKFDNS